MFRNRGAIGVSKRGEGENIIGLFLYVWGIVVDSGFPV